jgi:hypothetical protein
MTYTWFTDIPVKPSSLAIELALLDPDWCLFDKDTVVQVMTACVIGVP